MKLNSTKTGICYEVSGPVYENPDNGIWCGTTVDAKEGPCFVKLICYDHITDRMLRRNIREQAADEARALRQAGQVTPQVPRLIDDWDDEAMQAYVIIMEQLPGISLREWMDARPAENLTQRDLFVRSRIIFQVCSILQNINRRYPALIHRDLKPENIMLKLDARNRWVVSLLDFGCTNLKYTRNVGTLDYRAPEQSDSRNLRARNTFKTDIYSIGILFYEMLLGRVPREGTDFLKRATSTAWVQTPHLPQTILDLPSGPALENLLRKMTAYQMDDRPIYRDVMSQLERVKPETKRG